MLALAATERGDEAGLQRFLGLTILLGLGFLGFKVVEYMGEIRAGYAPWTGTFWSFYYTMTGLHALHVLGGIVVQRPGRGGPVGTFLAVAPLIRSSRSRRPLAHATRPLLPAP